MENKDQDCAEICIDCASECDKNKYEHCQRFAAIWAMFRNVFVASTHKLK